MTNYGATQDDWIALDLEAGLTADLLPVVSNPNIKISSLSNMREAGKTPSRLNAKGEVAGIPKWTEYQATEKDITRWMKEPDYGICIQTRTLRALDIDVPDKDIASRIRVRVAEVLGSYHMPTRHRANSAKCLIAFMLPGDMPKRSFKVRDKVVDAEGKTLEPAWIVEFLATGQQFVAHGTHPSGARIEWFNHEMGFPTLSLEDFEALWAILVEEFAIEAPHMAGAARRRGEDMDMDDPVLQHLDILDYGNDGQAFIECPWKQSHSMDSGITETAYFPAGSGGYEQGHFVCLHASCGKHTDTEFMEALGLRMKMSGFEVVEEVPGKVPVKPFPPMSRDKQGNIEPTLLNTLKALRHGDMLRAQVRLDEFRGVPMILDKLEEEPVWRIMKDADGVTLRERAEMQGFGSVGRELMRDTILKVADEHRYDSAIEWAENLPAWDGEHRVAPFLRHYFTAEDSPYTTAVSMYMWTALAGRVMDPGCKVDMVPILVSKQGKLKSSAIEALAPDPALFGTINLSDDDDKLARLIKGKLVVELAELRGLQSRESEEIKAWISRRVENWVPKYQENAVTYARRLLFIGTTNKTEFLVDDTGNRRWLPVRIFGEANVEAVIADRDQLWAEALVLWKKHGVMWQEAHRLGSLEHENYMIHDSWQDHVEAWLSREADDLAGPANLSFFTSSDVLRGALNIQPEKVTKSDEMRLGKVLHTMGFERVRKYIDGKVIRAWNRDADHLKAVKP